MPTFAEQIAKHVAKYKKRIDDTVRGTVIGLAGSMIEYAPRGEYAQWSETGRKWNPSPPYQKGEFAGSFDYSFGGVPDSYTPTIDASGRSSIERIKAGVMSAPLIGKHYIYNNAPYAMVIENNEHPLIDNWKLVGRNKPHITYRTMKDAPYIVSKVTSRLV